MNLSAKNNQIYLLAALTLVTVQWLVFKYFYPYPNLTMDSYYYAKAAVLDLPVNIWPIGYSKFLQFFSLFSRDAGTLVYIQYIFLELSCLVFFFSWRAFFRPVPWCSHLLFILLLANPIFLFCSNFILSDALFIGVSMLWFSLLLWIIYAFRVWMIPVHALLLLIAFTLRYNALYYVVVAAMAFFCSNMRIRYKLAGVLSYCVLIGVFVLYTCNRVAAIGGTRQFSPFGGWKLASNALYVYSHVYPDPAVQVEVPVSFRRLDMLTRMTFYRWHYNFDLLHKDITGGSVFMFKEDSPLMVYMGDAKGEGVAFLNTPKWYVMAPFYQSYGSYLIRKYPGAFLQYFVWPNFLRYCRPFPDMMGAPQSFELHEEFGAVWLRRLFGPMTIGADQRCILVAVGVVDLFTIFLTVLHILFLAGLAGYWISGLFRRADPVVRRLALLTGGIWGIDFCFSILSSAVVLRYELFVMVIELSFGIYFWAALLAAWTKKIPAL